VKARFAGVAFKKNSRIALFEVWAPRKTTASRSTRRGRTAWKTVMKRDAIQRPLGISICAKLHPKKAKTPGTNEV